MIEIRGQRIRLFGIDAPEGGQTCRGCPWPELSLWAGGVLMMTWLNRMQSERG